MVAALAGPMMAAGAQPAARPAAGAPVAAPRPMSFDDIMNVRGVGAPEISPDGRQVAFTVSAWEHPNANPAQGDTARGDVHVARSHLWLVPAAGGEPRQLTFGERGESSPAWSPDGRSLAFVAARATTAQATPTPQVWVLPMAGGEAWQLTDAREGVSSFAWSPDGRQVAFVVADTAPRVEEARRRRRDDAEVYESGFRLSHVWVIDVATRRAREVAHGDYTVRMAPSWSPDGTRLAFGASPTPMLRDLRGDMYVVTLATGAVERIAAAPRSPAVLVTRPDWSPDGRTLAFTLVPQGPVVRADSIMEAVLGNGRLVLYDVAARRAREIHDPAFDVELSAVRWTADGRRLRFTSGEGAYDGVFEYDVAANAFRRVAGGRLVRGLSYSRDGARVAFAMESATAPADVYVSDAALAAPVKLTDLNPQLRDVALGETEVVRWTSTDGTPVEGVLLKPVGWRPGTRYPLLVEVHGGPTAVTTAGFKGTAGSPGQYWAGRGWAVLYPNPRGSTGYGEAFMRANRRDWGGGDYQDIMTGVDALVRRGIADSSKLAMVGWSYGGYMAAWTVTQTTRFKAARMGAGMSNLLSMYGTTEIPGYIASFFPGASTAEVLELYRRHSPVTHADRVRTPLLILHGAADDRVPPGQAMELYRALRDRGVPVQLVLYPRAGHGLGEYYHQLDRLRRDWEWITRHTLGEGGAAPRR